jgi:hypothetical protein
MREGTEGRSDSWAIRLRATGRLVVAWIADRPQRARSEIYPAAERAINYARRSSEAGPSRCENEKGIWERENALWATAPRILSS